MCWRTLATGLELSSSGGGALSALRWNKLEKGVTEESEICLGKYTHIKVSGFQASRVWKADSIPKQGKSQLCKRVQWASKDQGHWVWRRQRVCKSNQLLKSFQKQKSKFTKCIRLAQRPLQHSCRSWIFNTSNLSARLQQHPIYSEKKKRLCSSSMLEQWKKRTNILVSPISEHKPCEAWSQAFKEYSLKIYDCLCRFIAQSWMQVKWYKTSASSFPSILGSEIKDL